MPAPFPAGRGRYRGPRKDTNRSQRHCIRVTRMFCITGLDIDDRTGDHSGGLIGESGEKGRANLATTPPDALESPPMPLEP